MLHQLLNVAFTMQAESVHSEAILADQDGDRALVAWELELHRPFSVPLRATPGVSRVGPEVGRFMPLPPPPGPRSA